MFSETKEVTAEENLRAAFERLKADRPLRLKSKTEISQNNVAREAGVDPSALRKSRYPGLIREIQAYIEVRAHRVESARQRRLQKTKSKITADDRIKQLIEQRDIAQAQLVSAHRIIVELSHDNGRLRERLNKFEMHVNVLNR